MADTSLDIGNVSDNTNINEAMPGEAVSNDNTPVPLCTQPQVQTTMVIENTDTMPNNHMIAVCLVIWLCPCSIICGLVAFFYSKRVKCLFEKGDYEGADEAAKSAKFCSNVGLSFGIIITITAGLIVCAIVISIVYLLSQLWEECCS